MDKSERNSGTFRVLMFGDIIGKTGRQAVKEFLPEIKEEKKPDLIGANCENLAGGFGISEKTVKEMFSAGIDFFTSGNHIWDKREGYELIKRDPRILRPANYPKGVPGRGYTILTRGDVKIGIVNLQGRKFLSEVDSPFYIGDDVLKELEKEDVTIRIIDFHAETTSEKVALGWYFDGRVSLIVGTHTHVQTADSRILPGGTGYITDLGMCGARDSVIGMKKEIALERFLKLMPKRFEVAKGALMVNGILADIDINTGKTVKIERIWKERE